jgi:hypothetical protein
MDAHRMDAQRMDAQSELEKQGREEENADVIRTMVHLILHLK